MHRTRASSRRSSGRRRLIGLLATTSLVFESCASPLRLQRRQSTSSNVTYLATANETNALSSTTVTLIKQLLNTTATKSWEIGTHLEALTEYDYPTLGVFFDTYSPVPDKPYAWPVMSITNSVVSSKEPNALQLTPDGSAADPCSIGVATILASYSYMPTSNRSAFGTAAAEQLQTLLDNTPKTSDGALSHRTDELALWSDFVYMVPPFLAYYGTTVGDTSLIQAAYDQCRLYRQYLRTPETGLWRHILWGSTPDNGLWATGNGWAAAGMMRVYATIINSDHASNYTSQTNDLAAWILEIVEAAFRLQLPNSLFNNYLNQTSSFQDAAAACLLTSVSFRLAQLKISDSTLEQAQASRIALHSRISTSTGILSPVVDPMSFRNQGRESPEGQAFILLMEAAWADYTSMSTVPNPNGAGSTEGAATSDSTKVSSPINYMYLSALVTLVACICSL